MPATISSLPETGPLCKPEEFRRSLIGEREREAALEVIDRAIGNKSAFDRYGGVEVDTYEREFAAHMGTKFATATSSGTASIHTAVTALNLSPGSEVICPPITDPGGVGPVLACLCIPVFADTDPETFNVTAESIEKAITPQTKAIIIAHIAGDPCDMDAIMEVANRHGLPVIEDAAQAHDAKWRGRKVGSLGTLGAFSLMSGKHHTSGGQGGMITTNDETLYWRAKSFADRGKGYGQPGVGGFFGLNYRMTELEAAIGRVQLQRLPEFVANRRAMAKRLEAGLAHSSVFSLGEIPEGGDSVYWFLRVRVKDCDGPNSEIAAELKKRGVLAAPTYTSIIYKQPWFANKSIFGGGSDLPWSLPQCKRIPDYTDCCPNAEAALANHLMVSFNESIKPETVDRMIEAFLEVDALFTS